MITTSLENNTENAAPIADLDAVIAESKVNIAVAEEDAKPKKRGRPKKSDSEPLSSTPSPAGAIPIAPKPAGLAPILMPLVDLPVYGFRRKFQLNETELPLVDKDAKEMLVGQADLVIGIFCPDASNNKWVMLASLLGVCGFVYGGMFLQAKEISAAKIEAEKQKKEKEREQNLPDITAPINLFPSTSI